jgi:flagellar motor switch protein FliN/FliY
MLLEVSDAIIIADLMMGGEGEPKNTQFTELELSAVAEAMNQMIGSASTSMATMINRKVDILPPVVNLWENEAAIDYDGIVSDEDIYRISFSLNVEGVIESEIMQIFTNEVVNEIMEAMLADQAEDLRQPVPEVEKKVVQPEPQPVQAQPSQPIQQAQSEPQWQQSTQQTQRKVEINQAEFQPLTARPSVDGDNLDLILDVPLDLSVILGKSKKSIKEILSLNTGSVVELDKLTDEPLEILVNGKLIATGEVVVINENFGVRITNILSPKQRLHHLN